ncbi:MAG: tRNA (cytidine(56)-2'-O)-methyltransferase [Methanocalculus sp. MSAO_Arc1]|uniref:tRNA (cytidine(56)-2'-O)-methyltransferase n=1 Tax=Methanocalculus TaxID=71151 RepID=UPI000FF6D1B2|nr:MULTISPECIES: tRNA (cytidine(56)-2'-O)-methyltransferase [unclassified Methanocalculus]MCP1662773.1 tRNA (cytidine56-2'-O)-methyltransferase [Methanocalculus sp. AMF5]RQD81084.1 MAG: tRNA (cytidine(56)-2'-O)-methyltransferase [Methanocalculus sp. MSAO_Arc1]
MVDVAILRIGHRHDRDQRVTTHVGLTARALGAEGMYLAADDPGVARSIMDVVRRFGGSFFVENNISYKRCIREYQQEGSVIVHLTMYGLPIQDQVHEIKKADRVLVIVGAEKVPGEVYGLADYNIAVTNQPHSEIAGLAVFLDHLFEGKELEASFPGGEIEVIPSDRGKEMVER